MTTTNDDDPAGFHIDFAHGRRVNLDAIRQRRSAFMPDNGHAWVISTTYALDDPEGSLETMQLDDTNFVGVSPIYCLLCQQEYVSANRFHKCTQTLPDET